MKGYMDAFRSFMTRVILVVWQHGWLVFELQFHTNFITLWIKEEMVIRMC